MRTHVPILTALALAVLAAAAALVTPAARAQTWAWCTTDQLGANTWANAEITYNNVWNQAASPGPQRMCANGPADVKVTSTQAAGNTAVLAYPAVQYDFPDTPVSSLTRVHTAYTENGPRGSGNDWEFASDDWLTTPGGPGNQFEVMVWQDNNGQTPYGPPVASASMCGGQSYRLYHAAGASFTFLRQPADATSGAICHLQAYRWLIRHGYLPADTVLQQEEIGWEVCSTGGQAGTFTITRNTLRVN